MSDMQLGRIEQYLKRLTEAVEQIAKNSAPPAKPFSDPKKPNHTGPYWGDSGWGSGEGPTHER